jgi:hypothetical protein
MSLLATTTSPDAVTLTGWDLVLIVAICVIVCAVFRYLR